MSLSLWRHLLAVLSSAADDPGTPAQRQLRLRLVYHLLGVGARPGGTPTEARGLSELWALLDVVLPYRDALVIGSPAPDALAHALTGPGAGAGTSAGMPGLRADPAVPGALLHLPSGAGLVVQHTDDDPRRPSAPPGRRPRPDLLTAEERRVLATYPPASDDAADLLTAFVVRLPLSENKHLTRHAVSTRLLWGHGDNWHVHWPGPITDWDVGAVITDVSTGNPRITARYHPRRPTTLHHGAARLTLHPPVVPHARVPAP